MNEDTEWFKELTPEKVVLTKDEAERLLDIIENPPEPNEKLKEALESYCTGALKIMDKTK